MINILETIRKFDLYNFKRTGCFMVYRDNLSCYSHWTEKIKHIPFFGCLWRQGIDGKVRRNSLKRAWWEWRTGYRTKIIKDYDPL